MDDAARFFLEHFRDALPSRPRAGISELLDRGHERRKQLGIPELSEEEAVKLAVEEQHAWCRGE